MLTQLRLATPIIFIISFSHHLSSATGMGFTPTSAPPDFYAGMRPRSKQTSLQVNAPDPSMDLATAGTARIELVNPADDDFAEDHPSPTSSSSSIHDVAPAASRFLNLRPRSSTLAAAANQISAPSSSQSPEFAPRQRSSTLSNAIPPTSPMSVSSAASAPGQGAHTTGGAGGPTQKRKRSRVTPDQLTHLERVFAHDRSPTAARRKEISDTLGMQERQTQIWFQNRSVALFFPLATFD